MMMTMMKRVTTIALLLSSSTTIAWAQQSPSPEDLLAQQQVQMGEMLVQLGHQAQTINALKKQLVKTQVPENNVVPKAP